MLDGICLILSDFLSNYYDDAAGFDGVVFGLGDGVCAQDLDGQHVGHVLDVPIHKHTLIGSWPMLDGINLICNFYSYF